MTAISRNCRVLLSFAAITAMGLACAGCPDTAADSGTRFTPIAPNAPVDAAREMPAIPKDAQYTIVCRNFTEDSHVQDARVAQMQLHDSTSMKKWYVVHLADHSALYYGFYRSIDPRDAKDAAEGKRAIDDLDAIRAMTTSDGQRLFSEALLVNIVTPDPEANPAWDITRTKGTWSIEIGSFTTADRKQKAVDAVRQARAEGTEAYYYHGETASSVCIGSWPAESAIEVTPKDTNLDPNVPLVVGNTDFSPAYAQKLKSNGMQVTAPHVDIVDLTLTATINKWPAHSTDGMTRVMNPNTSAETPVERSFLFKIPHRDVLNTMGPTVAAPQVQAPAHKKDPSPGELRSIGE